MDIYIERERKREIGRERERKRENGTGRKEGREANRAATGRGW